MRTRFWAVVASLISGAALAGCGGTAHHGRPAVLGKPAASSGSFVANARRGRRPNIVFVLTDDLSMDLLQFMPHVQALQRRGMTFSNYFVSDSLCCPSRASIFTGDLPHDTHVLQNFGVNGGVGAFHRRGEDRRTFVISLRRVGYRTALMGKYLNGYLALRGHSTDGSPAHLPVTYVPPGWTDWDVAGWGYPEFNYALNQNGVLHHYGHKPGDYLTGVIARLGVRFINRSAAAGRPFFLELATFAPHGPSVPAPQDARKFQNLKAPRRRSFNRLPSDPPRWFAPHRPLTRREIADINRRFRLRVRSVQAIDRMLGEVEQTLAADHLAGDTYVVFSSDNGFHSGDYRLMPGKQTAFDTDIRVPLIIAGPHVRPGSTTNALCENIDLAETFTRIARTTRPGDGHSLLALLRGARPRDWRDAVLIEHHGPNLWLPDPDQQRPDGGDPPSYDAIRTAAFLYVEYTNGDREYYDLRRDRFELHNIASRLPQRQLRRLHNQLLRMQRCQGRGCWRAMHL